MSQPVDLTDVLGHTWCLSVCRLPGERALTALGADPSTIRRGAQGTVEALADSVPLLARPAGDGWSVVLEWDGWDGWKGFADEGLERLSQEFPACSVISDPTSLRAGAAQEGLVVLRIDLESLRYYGVAPNRFSSELAELGLRLDADEHEDDQADWTLGQRAAVLIEAVTGVRLDLDALSGGAERDLT